MLDIQPVKKWLADQRDPATPNKMLHLSGGTGKQALVWVLGQALERKVACLPEIGVYASNVDIFESCLLSIEDGGTWPDDLATLIAAILTRTPYVFRDQPGSTWTAPKVPIVVVSFGRGEPLMREGLDFRQNVVEFACDYAGNERRDVTFWKEALGVAP